jgi:hypothetical protein
MSSGNPPIPTSTTQQSTAAPPPVYQATPTATTPGGASTTTSTGAPGNTATGAGTATTYQPAAPATPVTMLYDPNDVGVLAALGFSPGFAQDPSWMQTLCHNMVQAYPQWGATMMQRYATPAMPTTAGTTMPTPIGGSTGMSTSLPPPVGSAMQNARPVMTTPSNQPGMHGTSTTPAAFAARGRGNSSFTPQHGPSYAGPAPSTTPHVFGAQAQRATGPGAQGATPQGQRMQPQRTPQHNPWHGQQAQSMRNTLMKHVKIPTYTGAPGQFRPWDQRVTEVLTLTQTDPADYVSLTRLSLEGNAATFAHHNDPDSMWTFDELMLALEHEFEVTDGALTHVLFYTIRMEEGELLSNFLRRLENAYVNCFPNEPRYGTRYETAMRGQVITGLTPALRVRCASALTERTYADMREKLKNMESLAVFANARGPRKQSTGKPTEVRNTRRAPLRPVTNEKDSWDRDPTVNEVSVDEVAHIVRTETAAIPTQSDLKDAVGELTSLIRGMDRGRNGRAPRVAGRPANGRTTPEPSRVTCHKCQKKGHVKRDCPEWENQEEVQGTSRSRTPDASVVCYGCREPGHMIRECPNRATVNTILSDVRDRQGSHDDYYYDTEEEEDESEWEPITEYGSRWPHPLNVLDNPTYEINEVTVGMVYVDDDPPKDDADEPVVDPAESQDEPAEPIYNTGVEQTPYPMDWHDAGKPVNRRRGYDRTSSYRGLYRFPGPVPGTRR